MQLLTIETSRIVFLMQALRTLGQVYIPDAIAKVKARYAFFKAPNPDQVLPLTFSIGKFRDVGIAEFSIYNDGFVVSSNSNTNVLDAFIEDLLEWAAQELSIERLPGTTPEKFYESSIVVRAESDLVKGTSLNVHLNAVVSQAMQSANITAPINMSGLIFDFDNKDFLGKRKPVKLIIDRRLNVAFSENIFFSQAPFRTDDHLKVLEQFEGSPEIKENPDQVDLTGAKSHLGRNV
jgi:hypothetical protein